MRTVNPGNKPNPMSIRNMNSLFSTRHLNPVSTRHLSNIGEEEGEEEPEGEVLIQEEAEAVPKQKGCSKFCSIMDRFPLSFVLGAAVLGFSIGIGLAIWNPTDPADKVVAIMWIGLVGDLFIRALKCIVLPLVFVSIAVSVMDMLALGEAGTIVGTTIGLYVFTTICAALIGCVASIVFSSFYALNLDAVGESLDPEVKIGCSLDPEGNPQSFLTQQADGSVMCMDNGGSGNSTIFALEDINGYFQKSPLAQGPAKLTLSESLFSGLFMQLIGSNMFLLFTEGNFLGVIVLGAGFGVALVQLSKDMPPDINWDMILTIQILEEVLQVFMKFIGWIIKCTPFAVVSLIAAAVGDQTDLGAVFSQIGYLFAAVCVGLIFQFVVVYSGLYIIFMRKNPLKYYKQLVPAMTLAFATSSSAATIPVSIDCAVNSGDVPVGIARFVVPLGATINMDGSAIYIICACVWMAYQNGIVPTVGEYILLIIAATVGSMGAAPVPSAAIVMMLVAYSTAFGSTGTENPAGLAYIFAIDWIVDRLTTSCNVVGDLTVTAIVANKVNKDVDRMIEEENIVLEKKKEGEVSDELKEVLDDTTA